MSKRSDREIEQVRQHADLTIQYQELLCLRARVAGLLFPLKGQLPRRRIAPRINRSAAPAGQLNTQKASTLPILLLLPERPLLKPPYTSPFGLG
jgi:hypothetical protein